MSVSFEIHINGFEMADAVKSDGDEAALLIATLAHYLANGELTCTHDDVRHHFAKEYAKEHGHSFDPVWILAEMLMRAGR